MMADLLPYRLQISNRSFLAAQNLFSLRQLSIHYKDTAVPKYNPAEIEPRWQRYWDENKTFATERECGRTEAVRTRHVPLPQR